MNTEAIQTMLASEIAKGIIATGIEGNYDSVAESAASYII